MCQQNIQGSWLLLHCNDQQRRRDWDFRELPPKTYFYNSATSECMKEKDDEESKKGQLLQMQNLHQAHAYQPSRVLSQLQVIVHDPDMAMN
jgi:hypothetical protein